MLWSNSVLPFLLLLSSVYSFPRLSFSSTPWRSYHPHPGASLLCIKHNYFHPSMTHDPPGPLFTSLSPHRQQPPLPPTHSLFSPPPSTSNVPPHTLVLFPPLFSSLSWLPCMPPPQPSPAPCTRCPFGFGECEGTEQRGRVVG